MYRVVLSLLLIDQLANILDWHFPGETLVFLIVAITIFIAREGAFKKSALITIVFILLSLLHSFEISVRFIYGVLYITLPLFLVSLSKSFKTEKAWIYLYSLWFFNLILSLFAVCGFNHISYLPTYGALLFGLIILVKKNRNIYDNIAISSILIFLIFSLSLKAIASVLLIILLRSSKIISLIRSAIIVSMSVFLIYIALPNLQEKIDTYVVRYGIEFVTSPRGILYANSIKIAKDYFPFGSGAGSYGSPSAVKYESEIYSRYNVGGHGLNFNHIDTNNFFFDAFWSGIIGELGFVFAVLYGVTLFRNYSDAYKGKIFIVVILFQSLWTHFINDLSLFLILFLLIPNIIRYERIV